jgi:outer membrane murein-binding lipoprotein Lpp
MKRFLMLVAVAAVAGAMYVAASPASQQSRGPTAKQFNALKKQVATLSKSLKATKTEANAIGGFITTCLASALPVSEFGDAQGGTFGYWYTDTGTTGNVYTSALDTDGSSTPGGFLQIVDPSCVQGTTPLGHAQTRLGNGHLLARPERGLVK